MTTKEKYGRTEKEKYGRTEKEGAVTGGERESPDDEKRKPGGRGKEMQGHRGSSNDKVIIAVI